ncbi:hypothetical protein L6R49_09185 [Myxococcota bacterium]|nr:hypothetical protein [Myxococcota bacterium]
MPASPSADRALTVLAPGKLVLVGEYAVLDGAPAVVAAVDRGVRCEVRPGDAVETPADDRFARAALQAVSAPPRRYRFSDWNPVSLPEGKAGFGGSAAACVAAVVAGRIASGHTLSGADAALARRVHQEVQGSGSGVDVLASWYGGLRRFEGLTHTALPARRLVAVYSGRSASTGPRVQRYLQWSGRQGFVDESAALADLFAADPIAALQHGFTLLCNMARAAGVEYETPGLRRIVDLAASYGGAAKPSGAGGGDVAVAMFPEAEAEAAFCAACAAEGLPPIPVTIALGAASSALSEP